MLCFLSLTVYGCLGEDSDGSRPPEGQLPGDCSDDADNDGDGLFDCNDDGCAGAGVCADDDDAGDDDDETADDDDSAGDDDDTVGDDDDSAGDDDDAVTGPDEDGDSFVAASAGGTDCDDANPTINPSAIEQCDELDNDCNGFVDDDPIDGALWHLDSDSDGYGGQFLSEEACSAPTGYVDNTDDCDDLVATIYPGATELCNGLDDDCDGELDNNAPAAQTWYLDNDGDGVGGLWLTQEACSMPAGYAGDSNDCDDTNAAIYPAAPELCDGDDNDCDGSLGSDEIDDDGDGVTECSQDCDDTNPLIFPGSVELCDGIDNDCDVSTVAGTGETDADGDLALACNDCDDDPVTGPASYPGAAEICDGADNDCDGTVDVGATNETTWYFDADGDTYGGFLLTQQACTAPTGYVASSDDCAELDPNSYPGAPELCDGIDNDCNGQVDDGAGAAGTTWYGDSDADGFGDPGTSLVACAQPAGFVSNSLDCDDGNTASNPGGYEICDGSDNNCDGSVDESSALDAEDWYIDNDGDGYGRLSTTISSCTQPIGYADNAADCDDDDGANAPNGPELCDGQDNDCNGAADFDSTGEVDADADGSPSCVDCDDADPGNQPGGTELCDGYDNDCNAGADMDVAGEVDVDGDGSLSCADCDDGDDNNVPGGVEVCDGQDNDCTGGADFDSAGEVDADSDGSFSCADCDDDPATGSDSYPGNPEVCDDGTDQDCDGSDPPCFTQAVFTTCGQTGGDGPSQSQCNSAYSSTSLDGLVTLQSGVQRWTVPGTANYSIEARAAEGGEAATSATGGLGARMKGDFQLVGGEDLYIVVGQKGLSGRGVSSSRSGGGGGGSFIYRGNSGASPSELLLAAGGGAGAPHSGGGQLADGGVTGTSGTDNWNNTASGGSGGNGGGTVTTNGYDGGGGAGWNSSGGAVSNTTGGSNYSGNWQGGYCYSYTTGYWGGFGGGGGSNHGAGGGGGYSGGAGGQNAGSDSGGGGGGSFNSGSNQDNSGNANSGHGQVTISLAN
jgi:hypothetical protein